MKFSSIYNIVKTQWLDGGPNDIFFVQSAPGIGKSALAKQLGSDPDLAFDNVLDLNPSLLDTPDLAGIYLLNNDAPYLSSKHNEALYACQRGRNLIIWEEVPDSPINMQNLVARWIYDGNVNGLHLSEQTYHILLGNRSKDKSGAGRVSTKLSNRTCVLEMEPDLDDWVNNFAIPQDVSPIGIQFLRYRPELFCKFDPDAPMGINPTPRAWTRAFRTSERLPDDLYLDKIAGEVGSGPAAEFMAFRKIYRSLLSIEEIVVNPGKVEVPKDLSALYAIVGHLAYHATPTNIERVAEFVNRLPLDFATKFWDNARKRNKNLHMSAAFRKWVSVNGSLMFGG